MESNRNIIWIFVILMVLSALMRFVPHMPNVTPVGALALTAGLYLRRSWAVIPAILVMVFTDIFVGLYHPGIMLSVYGGFVIMALMASTAKGESKTHMIAPVLAGSMMFFLITNAAVWWFSGFYEHTASGLMQSYTLALPFFRNSLIGNFVYTALFVAVIEYAYAIQSNHATAKIRKGNEIDQ
ncbi:MAG: DUF6580 family putative transport protein [Parcubacteria group bacterium]